LSVADINYSLITGICVGAGTIAFFLLLQKGGPLSSVPAILAGGAAIMAIAGILFFREAPSWQRIVGVAFAIIGLFLLRQIVSESAELWVACASIVSVSVMM
jgi:transporter family protein